MPMHIIHEYSKFEWKINSQNFRVWFELFILYFQMQISKMYDIVRWVKIYKYNLRFAESFKIG